MERNERINDVYNKGSNWVNIEETPSTPSPVKN